MYTTPGLLEEIDILKAIHHDNVIFLQEVIDDAEHAKVYLVLELVEIGAIPGRKKGLPHVCHYERRRIEAELRVCQPSPLLGQMNFLDYEPTHDVLAEHYSYVPCITRTYTDCLILGYYAVPIC